MPRKLWSWGCRLDIRDFADKTCAQLALLPPEVIIFYTLYSCFTSGLCWFASLGKIEQVFSHALEGEPSQIGGNGGGGGRQDLHPEEVLHVQAPPQTPHYITIVITIITVTIIIIVITIINIRFLFDKFQHRHKPTVEEMFSKDFSINGCGLRSNFIILLTIIII